jgi:hypothetical protein
MYQFPLMGSSFQLDNQAVFRKLKAFLINSPGWAWNEPHNAAKNGRAAYMAWTVHHNGCPMREVVHTIENEKKQRKLLVEKK